MTDKLSVSLRAIALAALGLAFALPAMAGQTTVTATISNGQDFDFLAAAGSFAVHAYSEQNGAKNATVTPTVVVGVRL